MTTGQGLWKELQRTTTGRGLWADRLGAPRVLFLGGTLVKRTLFKWFAANDRIPLRRLART
ncbi:MAG TPA: hypothetical protein VF836_08850, partial [Gemmatimonadaceae bacterium]